MKLPLVALTRSESRISCSILPEPQLVINQRRVAVTQKGRYMSKATNIVPWSFSLLSFVAAKHLLPLFRSASKLPHHRCSVLAALDQWKVWDINVKSSWVWCQTSSPQPQNPIGVWPIGTSQGQLFPSVFDQCLTKLRGEAGGCFCSET